MFEYINSIADKIIDYNKNKFQILYEKLNKRSEKLDKKTLTKERTAIDESVSQVPLLGFNSGKYDINLIKKEIFDVIGCDNLRMVIKNPGYMCIATDKLKMLDISNYITAGTSYDTYLKTYLGKCQCEDKIRCTCELSKGNFPYEYITTFDKLNETGLPPREAFDSKLRNTKISDDDYERMKFVWNHYNMNTISDLLIWYNNLDVAPFVKAIKIQREFYRGYGLDIFTDGSNVSADRVNNNKGHINGNINISCISCNVARKDMSIIRFKDYKLTEANANKLIWSIDEEHKDIFYKMKANIAGGPSIIFNRYAEANETFIRHNKSKLVKKIIGYDANALYLWAAGNSMPCGRLTTIEAYDGIMDDIMNDKQFGFLECDIETPAHLKEYFSEMTPIFKNIEINPCDESVIGSHMYEYNKTQK
ncbi:hypothetical protein PHYSODRAFT_536466, partial [Phytophthora sojae]